MPTRPTDPEIDSPSQGGWVRSKRGIPVDEDAVELNRWPSLGDEPEEDDEDEPTKDTESAVRVVPPPRRPA
jgi:hypothetical protein